MKPQRYQNTSGNQRKARSYVDSWNQGEQRIWREDSKTEKEDFINIGGDSEYGGNPGK